MTQTRIVALALLTGEFLFAGVICFMAAQGLLPDRQEGSVDDLLQMVFLVVGFSLVPAAWLLRRTLMARAAGLPAEQQPQARLAAFLIGMALLEGGVILNLVAWMVTGTPMPNVALAGLLVVLQLFLIPRD